MMNGIVFCNRCGTQNSAPAKFCAKCGTSISVDPPSAPVSPETVTPQAAPPVQMQSAVPPVYNAPMLTASMVVARYGGFWIRFVAFVIDAIAVGIVTFPVSAMIAVAIGLAGGAVSMPDMGVHLVRFVVSFVFSGLVNWIYEAALESSSHQATLGKMALGLKVTDERGQRISFLRATGRHFAKFLSGMILLVGYIMAGFTARKQALHDMVAGTLVVRAL